MYKSYAVKTCENTERAFQRSRIWSSPTFHIFLGLRKHSSSLMLLEVNTPDPQRPVTSFHHLPFLTSPSLSPRSTFPLTALLLHSTPITLSLLWLFFLLHSSPFCPLLLLFHLLYPWARSAQEEPCVSKVDWMGNRSRASVFIKLQLRHLAPTPVWRPWQIGDSSNNPAAHAAPMCTLTHTHTKAHTYTSPWPV